MTEETLQRYETIDPESISALVHRFYGKVRQDEILGPVFEQVVQDDWEPHLQKMISFWTTVMLGVHAYSGSPLTAHQAVPGIQPEHFVRWLRLFAETTEEMFDSLSAERIQARATRMGKNLTGHLFGDTPFWFLDSRQCS